MTPWMVYTFGVSIFLVHGSNRIRITNDEKLNYRSTEDNNANFFKNGLRTFLLLDVNTEIVKSS